MTSGRLVVSLPLERQALAQVIEALLLVFDLPPPKRLQKDIGANLPSRNAQG